MRPLALLVLTLGLAAPSPAQRHAIVQAFTGYLHMPNSPAAKDNKILAISVSKLDPHYADARLNSKSAGPSFMLFHLSHGTWWVVDFGSSFGCDAGPKAVMNELKLGCAPPSGLAWINTCGPLVSKPSSLVLACADANYSLERIAWRGWGRATTTAKASVRANDCKPYCAAGHFHTYPVTITADRLARCGLAPSYMRLTIVYAGARPAGIAKRDVHILGC
ncbi:MAG TPA: hypothetical protein VGG88_10775 [Gaiellaceae bacterium]|jgi:hypothetical protein